MIAFHALSVILIRDRSSTLRFKSEMHVIIAFICTIDFLNFRTEDRARVMEKNSS